MQSFPPGSSLQSDEGRVLWRLDRAREIISLLISSPSRPDLTGLIEQAGWPTSATAWDTASLAPLLDRLEAEQSWRFRVTANPTHSIATAHGTRGKRSPHVTADQQQSWFTERAASWGFALESSDVTLNERGRDQFTRRTDGTERNVPVSFATFDGVLRVVDPAALRHSLTHGMGRAKAYGCGLMTLAPLS